MELHEYFRDSIVATVQEGGEPIIYAGALTIHAVRFEMQPDHECLAWIVDTNERTLLLDVRTIYAISEFGLAHMP